MRVKLGAMKAFVQLEKSHNRVVTSKMLQQMFCIDQNVAEIALNGSL